MQRPVIDGVRCTGCALCVHICKPSAIDLLEDVAVLVRGDDCNGCLACEEVCPYDAMHFAPVVASDESS